MEFFFVVKFTIYRRNLFVWCPKISFLLSTVQFGQRNLPVKLSTINITKYSTKLYKLVWKSPIDYHSPHTRQDFRVVRRPLVFGLSIWWRYLSSVVSLNYHFVFDWIFKFIIKINTRVPFILFSIWETFLRFRSIVILRVLFLMISRETKPHMYVPHKFNFYKFNFTKFIVTWLNRVSLDSFFVLGSLYFH